MCIRDSSRMVLLSRVVMPTCTSVAITSAPSTATQCSCAAPKRFIRDRLNLGLDEVAKKALSDADISIDSIFEEEPDAGLGNGGLGRLAACYPVSYTHLDVYKRQHTNSATA